MTRGASVQMSPEEKIAFLDHLLETGLLREEERPVWEMIRPERLKRMYEVLNRRTRYLSVVLEAVDDGHNQAAVLRSADAFGVQDVHVVVGRAPFEPSKQVTQSAHKWLTINRQPDIQTAIRNLQAKGYRVYASFLRDDAVPVQEIDLSQPVALVFGNEHEGVSEKAVALADQRFYIPMQGFVQSFNISVAAAITLYEVTQRARRVAGERYFLTPDEKRALFWEWVMRTLSPRVREQLGLKPVAGEAGDPGRKREATASTSL